MTIDLAQIIAQLVAQFPWLSTIIFIVGALRIVLKPLFSIARSYVDFTADPADNLALDKVEQSAFVKGLFYVLDWFASVKLVK